MCEGARGRGQPRESTIESLPLLPGFAGKFVQVAVQPKVEMSEAAPAVSAISAAPIPASAIPSANVSLNFRNLVTLPNESYARGLWTILGPWSVAAEPER